MAKRVVSVVTFCILFCALAVFPQAVFANEAHEGNPCVPTAQEAQTYVEDGTWDARAAYMRLHAHTTLDAGLAVAAAAREGDDAALQLLSADGALLGGQVASMPSVGQARTLALRVAFPDFSFESGDTLAALQAIFGVRTDSSPAGKSSAALPYDSVAAYYQRSSYGKLAISADAFDYTAAHNRSYYEGDPEMLFHEALAALSETHDLTRYDANNDGVLDCVYMHFAGGDEGWGSTWWSMASVSFNEAHFDGKRLGSYVLLHNPSNTPGAVSTAIHETGHALGLPDYYSYSNDATALLPNETGILTFDMMCDNTGDHNGFSKWALGWFDAHQVVRIAADAKGTTVIDGDAVGSMAAGTPVTRTLSAINAAEVAQTGGILVVGNANESIFSSYYLLQYDGFAGNNQVYVREGSAARPLPAGLRVYRVQAGLDRWGTLAHSNETGHVHNQLIELVDPDGDVPHGFYEDVPQANGAYGCMLHAGDELTPFTTPASTNFYESKTAGFTGLTIALTAANASSGEVRVSYSAEGAPEYGEFSLSPESSVYLGGGSTLKFQATSDYVIDDSVGQPYLTFGNSPWVSFAEDTQKQGIHISMVFDVDPGKIFAGRAVTVHFPEGYFLLGGGNVSDELEFDIPVTQSLLALDKTNKFGEISYAQSPLQTSPIVMVDDLASSDQRYFFDIENGILRQHRLYDLVRPRANNAGIKGFEAGMLDSVIDARAEGPNKVRLWLASSQTSELAEAVVNVSTYACEEQIASWHTRNSYDVGVADPAWLTEDDYVEAYAARDGLSYWLVGTYDGVATTFRLVKTDSTGAPVRTQALEFGGAAWYQHAIDVDARGCVAVSQFIRVPEGMPQPHTTLFFDCAFNAAGRFICYGSGTGCWLDDGRWLAVGEPNIPEAGGYGAPALLAETSIGHPRGYISAAIRPFPDVAAGAWYFDAAGKAAALGVIGGSVRADGTRVFDGEGKLTRAQMAQMLWNLYGNPAAPAGAPFVDVREDDWFCSAVAWAADAGLFGGYGDSGRFGPQDILTREQMATVMLRLAGARDHTTAARASLASYSDAAHATFGRDALSWALAEGIITGYSKTTLAPLDACTRAQAATILVRFLSAE